MNKFPYKEIGFFAKDIAFYVFCQPLHVIYHMICLNFLFQNWL